MITLHKVEVENIRALGHAVFEPLTDGGMTALNGPNGAGKSSILTALLWCLYGVTPDGVQQTALRRQGSEGQPCRVIVDFEHEQQIVTVERGFKGRNDSAYMIVKVNGIEQAKGKIRACEAWLVNLLGGLDAEGFMTAFVIRQKELDGLVKAKPEPRRKLIERLAGIDRMSTAVKTARDEETEVKRRIELLPGDPEALAAAKEALETAQQAAAASWETYEAVAAEEESAAAAFATAEADATAMQARVEAHTAAQQTLAEARHRMQLAEQQVNAAQRELDTVSGQAVGGSAAEVASAQEAYNAAQSALQTNKQAREAADRAVETARADAARAEQAEARYNRLRQACQPLRDAATEAGRKVESFPQDLDAQIQRTQQELAEASQQRGALAGEYKRLGASIEAMKATESGDPHCPTCATALADPAMLLASLQETQARVAADGKTAAARMSELEQHLQTLNQQATELASAKERLAQVRKQHLAADEASREAQPEAVAARETAEASARVAEEAKAAALSAAQQTTTLAARVEEAAEVLRTAQVAAAAAARIPELTQNRDAARQAHTDAVVAHAQAEQAENAARVGLAEKDQVFETFRAAQERLQAAQRAKVSAHGDFRVAEEQVKAAEKDRDAEDMKLRARQEAHALLEQKTAVKEALDFFRKDRIASLAPELSEIATDLIPQMTDGKFVAVELDEDFTPVITDDEGNQRPTYWLSGGEESAVAFALRVAIGEVISGSRGGLLWMDEPQTAMDAQRRPAMMSVIRNLPGRQPVMISHVSEATDMVDLVLDVVPDPDNGSTVRIAGATGGVEDPSALDALIA